VNGEVRRRVKTALDGRIARAEQQIAIATGDTRELGRHESRGGRLPIRYIITVQALREGWDCPFAYVLVLAAVLSSATAVEQLLAASANRPMRSGARASR